MKKSLTPRSFFFSRTEFLKAANNNNEFSETNSAAPKPRLPTLPPPHPPTKLSGEKISRSCFFCHPVSKTSIMFPPSPPPGRSGLPKTPLLLAGKTVTENEKYSGFQSKNAKTGGLDSIQLACSNTAQIKALRLGGGFDRRNGLSLARPADPILACGAYDENGGEITLTRFNLYVFIATSACRDAKRKPHDSHIFKTHLCKFTLALNSLSSSSYRCKDVAGRVLDLAPTRKLTELRNFFFRAKVFGDCSGLSSTARQRCTLIVEPEPNKVDTTHMSHIGLRHSSGGTVEPTHG